MNTTARYAILVLVVVVSDVDAARNFVAFVALTTMLRQFALHSILSFTHEDYGRATSLSNIASKMPWSKSGDSVMPGADIVVGGPVPPPTTSTTLSSASGERRANATILMLARNSDTDSAIRSVRELEDRFNHKFNYPWVFLNEEPFSDDFKTRISNVVSGPVEFGLIPHDHWFQPEWIDEAKATAGREKMQADNIIYGGSLSYRNMCRFNSGVSFLCLYLLSYYLILAVLLQTPDRAKV